MISSRKAAVSTLLKTAQSRGYSNIELDAAIKKFNLSGVERAFFTALFYGVIERKITLDYIISRLSSRRLDDIDIKVLTILETGIYQLRYMDKVPESAAVNESVKLCDEFYAPKNSGAFVNALLREYIRKKDEIPFPDRKKEYIKYLSVTYSVPAWLCEKWSREYGPECEKLLDATFRAPRMTLRVNTLKTSADELVSSLASLGVKAEKTKFAPNGVRLLGAVPTETLDALDGLFFVQDEASQIAVAALGASAGDTIVDCCAAPGGKSFGAAMSMENTGKVFSFDLHKSKIGLIEKGAQRLGITIISADVQNGAQHRNGMPEADKIICDVPCSGLGVIAKKPDIRYKSPDEFEKLPTLSLKILETAATYLKSGGDIVFSTCTLSKDENERTVEKFLASHPEFSLRPFEVGGLKSDGMLTLLPHVHKTDGFFIAKLHKN